MRQTISGMIAAIAVVAAGTVPASACGFDTGCGGVAVAPVYSGCYTGCRGGGWGYYERLPDPEVQYGYYNAPLHQYYYADQGPTYTGPGDFAPYPAYQENAIGVWGGYHHYYGYHPHMHGYHHGYALPPRVYYGHYNMRYGYHGMRYGYHGAAHVYGYGAHMMHRHY